MRRRYAARGRQDGARRVRPASFSERPEAVLEGVAELVGTDPQRIVSRVSTLLDDEGAHRKMARGSSPYGDGKAAERIARCIDALLQGRS